MFQATFTSKAHAFQSYQFSQSRSQLRRLKCVHALPTRKNLEALEQETGDAVKAAQGDKGLVDDKVVQQRKQQNIPTLDDAPKRQELEDTPKPPPPQVESNPEFVEVESSFTLAKVSFGKILTPSGLVLMFFGFLTYFELIPGAGLSPIMLVYGFPATILGLALQYAQLEPVPLRSSKAALARRDAEMTDIQRQVRQRGRLKSRYNKHSN